MAPVPMWDHDTQSRYLCSFPLYLPHEVFADEYVRDPSSFDFANFNMDKLPPNFFNHKVMVDHAPYVTPLGYYSDGVPFTRSDSFISYYMSNVLTGQRFMLCSLRKSDVCKCSCNGNCTYGTILRILAWSFNQIAEGVFPACDHLQRPFANERRAAKRGLPLAGQFRGALVEFRADLLEFVGAAGFKQWSNNTNPCWCCGSPKSHLYKFPTSMANCIWAPRDSAAYDCMVRNSTKRVHITDKRVLKLLLRQLELNDDAGGLALKADFPLLGLKKGWRLIEEDSIHDVHEAESVELPATFCFFDKNCGVGLNHLCPLFKVKGFTIEALALDSMHIIDLGVCQYIAGDIMQKLIKRNFCGSTHKKATMRHLENLLELRRLGCGERKKHKITPDMCCFPFNVGFAARGCGFNAP